MSVQHISATINRHLLLVMAVAVVVAAMTTTNTDRMISTSNGCGNKKRRLGGTRGDSGPLR